MKNGDREIQVEGKEKKDPKPKARQVLTSEPATDRESAQSETEFEDTPPKEVKKHTTRKVKGILKNKIRKTKTKNTQDSEIVDKDLTRSVSASYQSAALDESEPCQNTSSEDSDEEEISVLSE